MAVNEKMTKQAQQLSVCVTELEDEVTNDKGTVADFNVKLKAAEKRAADVMYD